MFERPVVTFNINKIYQINAKTLESTTRIGLICLNMIHCLNNLL